MAKIIPIAREVAYPAQLDIGFTERVTTITERPFSAFLENVPYFGHDFDKNYVNECLELAFQERLGDRYLDHGCGSFSESNVRTAFADVHVVGFVRMKEDRVPLSYRLKAWINYETIGEKE